MQDLGARQAADIWCGYAVVGAEAIETGKLPLVPSNMVASAKGEGAKALVRILMADKMGVAASPRPVRL